MLGKALSETLDSLRRLADITTSTPNEPLEPVRESQPQKSFKQVGVGAPRTPNTKGGGGF